MNKLRILLIALLAVLSFTRLPAQTVDALFDPNADGIVSSFALQSDGKILVGGGFAKIGGQPRLRIARLHSSGLIDASFNPGANNYVRCLSVQQDGKILVGGHFTSIRSQPRSRIARLHPDGALDAGFNPDSNGSLYAFALQLDGKIIVGGEFTAIDGQLRNRIARLHSDGVLDESFDPNANGRVSTIAVQTDGKILLGGEFTMIGGVVRNRLARLHVDGSLDESFNPDARGSVNCLVVLPDGKMVLGGSFAQVVGQTRGGIARLHSDGSLDSTFNPNPNPDVFTSVNSCALQADGKVLIGGAFTTIAGQRRENIARLNADGSLDSTFNPTSVNWTYSLMIQADGNVLAGGNFYSLGGFGRSKIGRLLNGPTTSTLAVTAGSQIDWQRGGSAPEIGQVTFENWNGSEWTSSGVAARVPGGWQAAGLSLPSNSWIRARGRVSGGDNNGSSGLIEQIVSSGGGPFPGISVAENGGTPFVSGQSILEFGNTTWYGNSQLRTITITNTGSAPLESLALQLSGNSAASFAVGPLATTSLGPGQSTSFAVQFNPIVDGLQGATLSISSNHAESLPFQLPLQGVGMRSDPSFNPGPNSSPQSIALQADGKVLVGGGFTSIGGQTRRRIARLHANGTLDAYFNPDVNNVVFSIAVQADGKILIGGDFTTVGGQTRNRIARLHADGSLDESFNPGAGSSVRCIVPQADGSILVGGTFTTLGGQSRNRIARLHHDGSLDQSFNPYASDIVRSIALQPDGKIILGGEFTTLSGQTRLRIARLHPDGSLDEGFTPADAGSVLCLALQADGKIVLGGTFTTVGGQPHSNVARLLADGSVDSSFHADVDVSVSNLAIQADGMILIGGDFSYVGGQPRSRIARIHPDGSPDASFNPGVGVENPLSLSALALQQDGMILVGGTFTTAGGLPRQNLARLLNESAASTLSQTGGSQIDWQRSGTTPELGNVSFDYWTAGVWTNVGPAIRVPGGWQVFGASLPANIWLRARGTSTSGYGNGSLGIIEQIASYGGTPLSEFIVTGNGTIPITSGQGALDLGSVELNKTSLSQTITITNTGSSPLLDFSHRISGVSAGDFIATPPSPSSIDPGESASFTVRFQPTVAHVRSALLAIRFNHPLASAFEIPLTGTGVQTDTTFVPGANDSVHAFGLQADGKIVIGGLFTTIAGQPRNRIARLHPDGSLDPTFNPGADGRINTMAMQSDGKILLGGWFTSLGGQTRNRIARIHPDGSLDESFNPDPNGTVSAMGIQPDGMIVIVGRFTTVAGQPRNRIARLFPDGSLDTSFNPDAGNAAHSVAFQPDGKIIVSGDFTTIGGLTRNRIARLNANGSVDSTFNPNANLAIRCLVIQPDGKILIGGDFTTIGGFTRTRIARLNANGSLDQFFNTDFFSNIVNSLALQADGKILVGFGLNVQSGKLIARLNTNGSIDTSLNHAPNQAVYSLMLQENGRILTGGDFTTIDGQPRSRIARLLTSSASSTLSVTGGDQIQWLRGGTVPEVDHVRFDYWNGSTWVSVGSPVRITGGWQASGLILPANSWIRARGISRGGYNTGSTGPIEQVSFGGTDQTFESWINQPAWNLSGPSSGPLADFDHDGVPNLLEYALGATDPTDRAAAFPVLTSPHLPQPAPQLRITFLRRTGGTEANGSYISGDLTYQPVATTDLTNWNIAPIPVPNPPDLPAAPEGFEWTSYAIPDSPETQSKGFIKLKVDAE